MSEDIFESKCSYKCDDGAIVVSTTGNYCICCLAQNVTYVKLKTCKHTNYIALFTKYKVDYSGMFICLNCHYMLKKIEKFSAQVDDSIRIITKQSLHVQPSRLNNLKISAITIINVNEDISKPLPICEIVEVKVEYDSSDDLDVPLAQIKRESSLEKVCETPVKKEKLIGINNFIDERYDGKIKVVTLSREEMISERQRDRMKESYKKFPYKCENCIVGFDHEPNLEDHIEKRHGKNAGNYTCDICKSVLGSEASYKEHYRRHYKRYECCECGRRYSNFHSVLSHYNKEHAEIGPMFSCEDCNFTTLSQRSYRYHRDKHKPKKRCDLCDSTFVNNAGLRVHMNTVHKRSNRIFSCDICDKVFKGNSGLKAHMMSAHSTNTAFCSLCAKHFKSERILAHHLKYNSKHIGDCNKFVCDECGDNFIRKSTLLEHIDFVHMKNTKYKCNKCTKVFKNTRALKRHCIYVHDKIRPPRNKICDQCGRGFTTMTILQTHVRTHTGERPYRCSHCPATFAQSGALYTHNKILHTSREQE